MSFFRKPKAKTKPAKNSPSGNSTQSWLPIYDVDKQLIYRKDGAKIAAIRVQPINLHLLSENEKLRKVKLLEEVLSGIDYSFQIISIARPVDLDAYIAGLEMMKLNEPDRVKSKLLSGYQSYAASMAISGEAVERHFYILLDQPVTSKKPHEDEAILLRRASELASNLTSADLTSHVCSDQELRDLLFIFSNPNQAAYERAPEQSMMLPPLAYWG